MLLSLFLRDFVIVDAAEIEFAGGFCALSGETGAGKSILLDALGLALGARADSAMIRPGATRTEIIARFAPDEPLRTWLAEHEIALDAREPELLLRRLVDADGRSRAFVNGAPVTVTQLKAVGDRLLEIHGQHASQSLLQTEGQRALLDAYAGNEAVLRELAALWRAWRDARRLLEEAGTRDRELAIERENLAWQLEELDALDLAEGEWEDLEAEQSRLAHAAALIETAQQGAELLSESDDAIAAGLTRLIGRLRANLRYDPSLAGPIEMLESALIQVDEAASDLSGYAARIDADPSRLEAVEQRVSAVFQAARKLRAEPGELPALALRVRERLADIDRAQDLDALRAEVDRRERAWRTAAEALSKSRRTAAKRLSADVGRLLGELGMPAARFAVAVEAAEPSSTGADQVELRFGAHESLGLRALSKVASGGELSRVSLAIAVSAANANPVQTLIFDEADAGVGGAVADAIGLLMRRLGDSRQVLAVTHLPQVAARAHRHFRVSKQLDGSLVGSRVELLDEDARTEEIARMLGGAKVTRTTREHARELIELGTQAKPPTAGKRARRSATAGR